MDKLTVYNFLVKDDSLKYESVDLFENAILNNNIKDYLIPKFWYSVYDIDLKQVICKTYTIKNGHESVKVHNGVILEYYKKFVGHKDNYAFISYDITDKKTPLEYYKVLPNNDLAKFDYQSNIQTGRTTDASFESLPLDYKNQLIDFAFKDKILYWADKPYGRIIGVCNSIL